MDPAVWLQKAYEELVELGPSAERDPADAWRASALVARLMGSPNGPVPPPDLLPHLPALLIVAGQPNVPMLLERVAGELESDEDPWGPLLDALLDADDAAGLLQLAGDDTAAGEMARRVAGLISLYPKRVLPLSAFAEMRLATVRGDVAVGRVWRAVEAAPAHILAEVLPDHRGVPHEIATLADRRDWLDAAWHQIQRSARGMAQALAAGVTAISDSGSGLAFDFAASLGVSRAPSVDLVWGSVRRLDIALKTTVALRTPPTCQLWYATSGGSAPLTTTAWRLEPGESPVLIIATESKSAKSFEEAVASGARAAGVLLVQDENEDLDAT